MRTKIRNFIKFYLGCSTKNRIKILHAIFETPAALIHEAFHIIFIGLFFSKIKKISFKKFYAVENYALHTNSISISCSIRSKFEVVIVSIAPLFAFVVAPFISWYLFAYLLLANRTVKLSAQDMDNVKNVCRNNKRVYSLLVRAEKIVCNGI